MNSSSTKAGDAAPLESPYEQSAERALILNSKRDRDDEMTERSRDLTGKSNDVPS